MSAKPLGVNEFIYLMRARDDDKNDETVLVNTSKKEAGELQ